ncbi:hypothetical protein BX286_3626 [Streptomyces sp. 3211.6]|uniref:antibiotic biosynthesis monooxygenase family protein n=1 Tax=unclassified Streptomyces TaxID=2593676 RepID=UPI000C2C73C3|nr:MULTISPECIES: antibiotic biosynthesis monooxygenase [unclassified Streptomyces]RKT05622.1 hypothetical protein BX286_3626 [Streptomyces sp. 3211.6]RPF41558.1 hypothetical protein EDD96_5365 [Streptomyces sp. Ag109_G2-6]
MAGQVLSEVSGVVAAGREADLVAAYRELVSHPLPDGLIRSELLRGQDGVWRIHTLWRDRAALEAVRNVPGDAPAPRLFREVGAEPALAVFEIAVHLTAQVGPV